MIKRNFSEQQLKLAFREAILDFNKNYLESRTAEDKLVMNRLILDFVGKVLNNLSIDYLN